MDEPKRSRAEERRYTEMLMELADLQSAATEQHLKGMLIPPDWHKIAAERIEPKKARITTLIDEDVLRWFKRAGPGYQTRVNKVLRTYMLGVISKELKGAFDTDWKGDPI